MADGILPGLVKGLATTARSLTRRVAGPAPALPGCHRAH